MRPAALTQSTRHAADCSGLCLQAAKEATRADAATAAHDAAAVATLLPGQQLPDRAAAALSSSALGGAMHALAGLEAAMEVRPA